MSHGMPQRRRKVRGFTLLELLIVIGVVSILLGFLLPALAGGLRAARGVECLNNLRSLGQALAMYRNENNSLLPFADRFADARLGWLAPFDTLAKYLDVPAPHLDQHGDVLSGPPFVDRSDYAFGTHPSGISYRYEPILFMNMWPMPAAQTVTSLWYAADPTAGVISDYYSTHNGATNVLLMDGSVQSDSGIVDHTPRGKFPDSQLPPGFR